MKNTESFLKTARERFQRACDAEREIREEATVDLRFVVGDQWEAAVKQDRELAKRPALVFNKLTGPIQQVANEARQNKPAIKVHPVDSGASKDTADVIQGIVRHIEYASSADRAYETALEYAVSCSFGYFRFLTDYCDEESFDQDISVEAIADPFSVYLDSDARKTDRSDMKWAFIVQSFSPEAYQARWPDSDAARTNFWEGDHDCGDWMGDEIRVAEYWTVETKRRTLELLSNGAKRYAGEENAALPRGVTVERTRTVDEPQVKQYIINGAEILEENEWAGKWIPIVPVFGKEITIEGKRTLISLVRHARDPQRLHNYYKTTEAETIALVPRPKWVGYVGQFKTKSKDWQHANLSNAAFLEADPIAVNGAVAPLPRWESFEPPVQALSVAGLQSADDIKAATNIYDASLGARSNETSGVAIRQREAQGDISNLHFIDNLSRAQVHAGRILIDLIPKIYDTAREVRIVGEDEAQKVITVNAPYVDQESGREKTHLLAAGRYDVTVSTGPSYSTKRQEAFDMLRDLAKAYPQLIQIAGDLIFRNSDVPGADALADRLKKTLPPALQNDDKEQTISPEAQAQLAQAHQMIEQLSAALNKLSAEKQAKLPELASRERIALINAKAGLIEAAFRAHSDDARVMFEADVAQIDRQLQLLPDPGMETTQTSGTPASSAPAQQQPAQPQAA